MNDDDDIISEWLQFIKQFQWKSNFLMRIQKQIISSNHLNELKLLKIETQNPYSVFAMCMVCFFIAHTDGLVVSEQYLVPAKQTNCNIIEDDGP